MKRIFIVFAAIALLAMGSSQLMAQGGGFMRMMGGGNQLDSTLLVMEEVQDELKLSDDQKEEIGEQAQQIMDDMRSEMRDTFMGGGGSREEMMESIQEMMEEFREEEKEVVALLNDDQRARLAQLRYQRMGNAMYQDEKVQKELGITKDQKEAIADAFETNQEEMQEAMADAREARDFGAMQSAMADGQKELAKSLDEILKKDQKKEVAKMKGEEFKFPEPQRRGGRGGRSDF
ncbi:MAG: hypothetical protein P8J33_02575 [Pirellulaceae bacterium]|nr:hypothetical protein [Pirellulaceae bacterium]